LLEISGHGKVAWSLQQLSETISRLVQPVGLAGFQLCCGTVQSAPLSWSWTPLGVPVPNLSVDPPESKHHSLPSALGLPKSYSMKHFKFNQPVFEKKNNKPMMSTGSLKTNTESKINLIFLLVLSS